MKILRNSSEAEMIHAFLSTELVSDRFSEQLKMAMKTLSVDEQLLLSADLENEGENALRKELLGEFRGYGRNKELFENFPSQIEWSMCSFSEEDLAKIRYINYSYWNELSAGTRSPLTAAKQVRKGVTIYGQSNEGFLQTAKYIENGGRFQNMIFLTADFNNFVIVEGHLRMTAYALTPKHFNNICCIVGKCSQSDFDAWA